MTTTNYKCPKHNAKLRTIEDYPGALVHNGCPDIFTVISKNSDLQARPPQGNQHAT